MKTFTQEIMISDEAFALLQHCGEQHGFLEYRDTEFETLEDFLASELYASGRRNEDWFMKRNSGGTFKLVMELCNTGLLCDDEDAYHLTYELSDLGQAFLDSYRVTITDLSVD